MVQAAGARDWKGQGMREMREMGKKVQQLRLAQGWTREELGRRVDYATAMIQLIEQGLRRPSIEKAAELARVFGVSVSDLLGDAVHKCRVTNNANGDHQTVFQHVEGRRPMGDELHEILREVVREVVDARCDKLVEEMRQVVREVVREEEDARRLEDP
jgi:transcriptional regulator with XRE-family HTH domain